MTAVLGCVYASVSYVLLVLRLEILHAGTDERALCLCLDDSSRAPPNWAGGTVSIGVGSFTYFERVWP